MNEDVLPDLIAAIEQQIDSSQTLYVGKTYTRLLKLGLGEGEAKSQMAICLGEEMDQLLKTRKAFDEKAYKARLDSLPMDEERPSP